MRVAEVVQMTDRADYRVAVVTGGVSSEAEVARESARCLVEVLGKSYADAVLLELGPEIGRKLTDLRPKVVFPMLHGSPGEDGTFQGLLEIMGLPYVGSGVRASACAMDKLVAKHILSGAGLAVARHVVASAAKSISASAEHSVEKLGRDVVVKPLREGSAVGVGLPHDLRGLESALEHTFTFDQDALIEERVGGTEVSVGILEHRHLEVLPIVELVRQDSRLGHRRPHNQTEYVVPARLPPAQYGRTQEMARKAHTSLGCRDLSRVDFIVPPGRNPVVLEVNTMPGLTPKGLYLSAAGAAGFSLGSLLLLLIERARARVPL